MYTAWPVACQTATASPITSSGKMTQVSHIFAVVNCSGRGSRWNSCMLTGQNSGQPPWVSSSPAIWAAQPSATAVASSGTCHEATVSWVRSAPVKTVPRAAPMPIRSPKWPPMCSARSAAE